MRIEKIKAYIGFAIRSGKVIFGSDKLFESKKFPYLVLISSTQNEKVTGKVVRFCESNGSLVFKLSEDLGAMIGRENCKVIGILDKDLSSAIINELEMEK